MMIMRSVFVGAFLLFTLAASAQNGSVFIQPVYDTKPDEQVADNFCNTLMQIIDDAPTHFTRSKGKVIETTADAAMWTANKGIPGTVASSFIFTTSWLYEGIVYQGELLDESQHIYNKYKKRLDECLIAKGFALTTKENEASALKDYPVLTYTVPGKGKTAAAILSVEYADNTHVYTVTVNVAE